MGPLSEHILKIFAQIGHLKFLSQGGSDIYLVQITRINMFIFTLPVLAGSFHWSIRGIQVRFDYTHKDTDTAWI